MRRRARKKTLTLFIAMIGSFGGVGEFGLVRVLVFFVVERGSTVRPCG
jgi:hypothetical protein